LLLDVSIIIPIAPEETELEPLLGDLNQYAPEAEILVVDTQRVSGRAAQMNEGAQAATRPYVWFLHADSRLSLQTVKKLNQSLQKHPNSLHYHRLKFLSDGPPLMFLNEWGCWMRSRLLSTPFGDQGLCLSKGIFDRIGGFDESLPYGEDHLLVWAARHEGVPLQYTGAVLKTSARRYQKTGWWRLTGRYWRVWLTQATPEWLRLVGRS
jgi:hypothetical protein